MRGDRKVNNNKCLQLIQLESKPKFKKWSNIKMGDILEIKKDEEFPTDMLLLYAKNEFNKPVDIIFIDTMNLDGETNLKPRKVADPTLNDEDQLLELSAELVYDAPSENLDVWDGAFT